MELHFFVHTYENKKQVHGKDETKVLKYVSGTIGVSDIMPFVSPPT